MEVRHLNEQDVVAIDRLRLAAPKHLGMSSARFSSDLRMCQPDFIETFLDPLNSRRLCVGAFEQNRLISFATATIRPEEDRWYLHFILSSHNTKYATTNGVEQCMSEIIRCAEAKDVFTYWYSIPKRYAKGHRALWSSSTSELSKYTREDYMVVPKFTRCSDQKLLINVMSGLVFPIDMLIRKVHYTQ